MHNKYYSLFFLHHCIMNFKETQFITSLAPHCDKLCSIGLYLQRMSFKTNEGGLCETSKSNTFEKNVSCMSTPSLFCVFYITDTVFLTLMYSYETDHNLPTYPLPQVSCNVSKESTFSRNTFCENKRRASIFLYDLPSL